MPILKDKLTTGSLIVGSSGSGGGTGIDNENDGIGMPMLNDRSNVGSRIFGVGNGGGIGRSKASVNLQALNETPISAPTGTSFAGSEIASDARCYGAKASTPGCNGCPMVSSAPGGHYSTRGATCRHRHHWRLSDPTVSDSVERP